MTAINVTVIGNLTADPELRFGSTGVPVVSFTVASNERYKDQSGEWQDGQTSFVCCNVWRDLAQHVADSVGRGDRVIVTGSLREREYETREGEKRRVWEVAVSEVGAALKYATVKVSKVRRDAVPVPEDPWQAAPALSDADAPAEVPF